MKQYTLTTLLAVLLMPIGTSAAIKSFDIAATSSSFNPSSITVDKGDSVTLNFTVPSNDSYCCGLDVRAPKFSTVTIQRGGSGKASFTADSSFTFSSYWPATQVHKADGTVTVQSSTQPPLQMEDGDEVSTPSISKVSPGKFKRKTSGTFTITITGSDFEQSVIVKVGKVKSQKVTLESASKIKAVVPRKNLKPGKHDVTVINQDGGKTTKQKAITIVK